MLIMLDDKFELAYVNNKFILRDVSSKRNLIPTDGYIRIFDTPYQMARWLGELYGIYEVLEKQDAQSE